MHRRRAKNLAACHSVRAKKASQSVPNKPPADGGTDGAKPGRNGGAHRTGPRRTTAALATASLIAGGLTLLSSTQVRADALPDECTRSAIQVTCTYATPGTTQFMVPSNVDFLDFDVIGASGGTPDSSPRIGGSDGLGSTAPYRSIRATR